MPGDVLFLRGSRHGIPRLRELAAAPLGAPAVPGGGPAQQPRPGDRPAGRDEEHLRDGGGPGLLGPRAGRPGPGRGGSPPGGPARRDEGPPRAVGPAGQLGGSVRRPVPATGLLRLSQAAEDLGDAAQQMVWLVEKRRRCTPSSPSPSARATRWWSGCPWERGRRPTAPAWPSCSSTSTPGSTSWPCAGAGATSAAPRPRGAAGDELIASELDEGHPLLAIRLGWRLEEDEDTGGAPGAAHVVPRLTRPPRGRVAPEVGGRSWRPETPNRPGGSGGGPGVVLVRRERAGRRAGRRAVARRDRAGARRGRRSLVRRDRPHGGAGRGGHRSGRPGVFLVVLAAPRAAVAREPVMAVSDPASPASSVGTTILVARPSAIVCSVSRYLIVSSEGSGWLSLIAP